MKERINLKKRFTGLFAMALVLSMMMGMTVNAADYVVKYNDNSYVLFDENDDEVPGNATLVGGDTVTFISGSTESNSGTLTIKMSGATGYLDQLTNNGVHIFNIQECTYKLETSSVLAATLTLTEVGGAGEEKSCSHGGTESKVKQEPTETEDGIIAWYCIDCGEEIDQKTISSYAFFLNNIIYKITNAEPGSTVEIKSEIWHSLSQDVMLALAARRDINVVITLTYEHEDYQYNIPAGTTIDTADKYYGPMYLGQLYGMTKLEN